jgi:hypothetical protein
MSCIADRPEEIRIKAGNDDKGERADRMRKIFRVAASVSSKN